MLTHPPSERVQSDFASEGYAVLRGVVDPERVSRFCSELVAEYERAKGARELFVGGGTVSGHLNCFPGAQSRFVYDALVESGVIELARQLSPASVRMPNIGCNMNLPGSRPQNNHIDGYASSAFMIVNVACMKTTLENGAIEIRPATHLTDYKYHEFVLARPRPLRVEMNAGDVLLRLSSIWHRGMPNKSRSPRPMLGFTWEEGGSQLSDPYSVHGGRIQFLPNRYGLNLSGRMREHAFARLPALGEGYLFMRSLLNH